MILRLDCTNSDIVSLYRRMKADGISDKTIDASDGTADGVVHCEGIAETALENAERYDKYIEKITGRRVSWLIDEKTKKAVRIVAAMARDALIKQGYRPGEQVFERRLAKALHGFILAPTAEQRKQIGWYYKEWFDGVSTLPFLDMGMASVARYVEQHGGMGLINSPVPNEFEATAQEFLAEGRGLCTVRSKILYAVLKEGGLKPFFAHMRPEDFKKNWPKMHGLSSKSPPPEAGDYFGGHIFVGIMNGTEPRYIEPNMPIFDADYDEYARPISLREMHHADMANLIHDIRNHDDEGPKDTASAGITADRLIQGALAIGDSGQLAYIFMTEGVSNLKKKDYESAILSLETALKYDPGHTQAKIAVCAVRERQGDAEKVKACYENLPDDATQKALGLANYYIWKKDYARAREFYKKAAQLGATGMNGKIAATYVEEKNYGKAEEYLRTVAAEDPSSFNDALLLTDALINQEKWQEAADVLKDALALQSMHLGALFKMTKALTKLGRVDDARRYALRYFVSLSAADPDKAFGEGLLKMCTDLAGAFGMWRELEWAAGLLWQRGFKLPAVGIAFVEAQCKLGNPENAGNLFERLEFEANLVEEPIPSAYYKHLAVIADCANLWTNLARACMKFRTGLDIYNIHMLHAAVKSKDEALIKEAASLAMAFAGEIAGLDPKTVNLSAVDQFHAAISEMPPGIGSHPAVKPVFAKYLATIAKIYEANGRPEAAKKAHTQAGWCGAK